MLSLFTIINCNISNSTELEITLEQLEVIERVFRFCSVLTCKCDEAQDFVRNQNQFENVNMVSVIASTVEFLARYFQVKMVKNDIHDDDDDDDTSRLISSTTSFVWKKDFKPSASPLLNDRRGVESIIQVLVVLSSGCVALKNMCQGPCIPNQLSANAAANGLPGVLSVLGTFLSHEKRTTIDSLLFGQKVDPSFSEEYNMFLSNKLLLRTAKTLEVDIVQFLVAMLEGVSQERVLEVGTKFDEDVLFFNLDRVYKNMLHGSYRDRCSSKGAAVAYLSTLLTIADAQEISQSVSGRSKNIEAWRMRYLGEGRDISEFLVSVEIIDKNGNIDRKYFPKPDFVKNYWNYPGEYSLFRHY